MKCPLTKASCRVVPVLILSLLLLSPVCMVFAQTSGTTASVIPPSNVTRLGQVVTVFITLAGVQTLYGVDATLQGNTSALQVINVDLRLGVEIHSDGVLHGNNLADENSVLPGDILVQENDASQELGQYRLAATSVAPAASFSGSGNIAMISFNVTSLGHSQLNLATELADYNPTGSSF